MAVETLIQRIQADIDKRSFKDAEKSIESLEKDILDSVKSTKEADKVLASLDRTLRKSFDNTEVEALTRSLKEQTDEIFAQERALQKRNDSFDQVSRDVGLAGDVQSNLGAIRGLAGSAGADGLASGLDFGGELVVLTEELPRLKTALTGLPATAKAAATALGPMGLAVAAVGLAVTAVVSVIQNHNAKMAEEANELRDILFESRKIGRDLAHDESLTSDNFIEQREAALARQQALNEEYARIEEERINTFNALFEGNLAFTGGDRVRADFGARAEFSHQEGNFNAQLEEIQQLLNANESELIALNTAFLDGVVATNDAKHAEQQLAEVRVESAQRELDLLLQFQGQTEEQLAGSIASRQREIDIIEDFIATGRLTGDALTQANQQLNSLRQDIDVISQIEPAISEIAETTADAVDVEKERARAVSQLTALQERATTLQSNFALKQEQLQQDRTIKAQRQLEDFNTKQQDASRKHQQKLLQIQASGQAKVAELTAELNSLPGQLNAEIAGIQQDGNREIADLNRDFMQSELEAITDFRDEQRKRTDDFNRETARQAEDHRLRLSQAEQDNNVIAFLQEQNSFKQSQKRRVEDAEQEDKEAQANFQKEQERAQQVREQKIADIQAQTAQEIAETRKTFETRRAELARELQEVQRNTQAKIQSEQQQFQESQRLAQEAFNRQQQRQQQDAQIADQRAREALQRELQAINTKAQAELQAVTAVAGATSQILALATQIKSIAGSTSFRGGFGSKRTSPSKGSSGSSRRSTFSFADLKDLAKRPGSGKGSKQGGKPKFAFASGGIVDRPTVALLGEQKGFKEAVIPFKPSEGIGRAISRLPGQGGGGGGVQLQVTFAPQIANINGEMQAQLKQSFADFSTMLEEKIVMGIQSARFNPATRQAVG